MYKPLTDDEIHGLVLANPANAARAIEAAVLAHVSKDVERWCWLRDQEYLLDAIFRTLENELLPAGETFESLDAAIDAAMQESRAESVPQRNPPQ